MDSFHIASDAAFWTSGCGDDQTAAWSETSGSVQPAPVFDFDLGLDSQFTVSTVPSRLRDYSRSPPQDTTSNSTLSFENPASSIATIANPNATDIMGFGPTFTHPYAEPSNLNQVIYPVSTQHLIVHRGR